MATKSPEKELEHGAVLEFRDLEPSQGRAQSETPWLLERDEATGLISAEIRGESAQRSPLVLVEGPAGIGKTSLLDFARQEAERCGHRHLFARCGELERQFPFGMVRQLFEPVLFMASEEEREEMLAGAARFAEPALTDMPREGRAEGDRHAALGVVHGLYWLVANLARERRCVLIVDDLHWADTASLRWFAYLTQRLDGLDVVAIVALRDGEEGNGSKAAGSEHLTGVILDPHATRVRPAALSPAAVETLLHHELQEEADADFCSACHEATGGNPFYVRELVGAIRSERLPPIANSIEQLSSDGLRSIGRAVLRRIVSLGEDHEQVARTIAILGDGCTIHEVCAVSGLDQAAVARATHQLAQAEILSPQDAGSFAFSHPIVRVGVYSSLGSDERATAHAAAARAIAELHGSRDRIALHLLKAAPVGDPWVVEILLEAGSLARRRGAPEESVAYLERALLEPHKPEIEPLILEQLGLSQLDSLGTAGLESLRAARECSSDVLEQSRIAREFGQAVWFVGRPYEAMAELESAIDAAAQVDQALALEIESQRIAVGLTLLSETHEAGARLVDVLSGRFPGASEHPGILASQAMVAVSTGYPSYAAMQLAKKALAGAGEFDIATAHVRTFAGSALLWMDQAQQVEQTWNRAMRETQRLGSRLMFSLVSAFRAEVLTWKGALPAAEADARSALEIIDLDAYGAKSVSMLYPAAFLIHCLIERAALEEAREVSDGVPETPESSDYWQSMQLAWARGRLVLAEGDFEGAGRAFVQLGDRCAEWGVTNPAVIPWRSGAASAMAGLGEQEEAERLANEEIAIAREMRCRRSLGLALRTGAMTRRGSEGLEMAREAVAVLGDSPARLELAHAHLALGIQLLRRGRRAQAREPLRTALDLASRLGGRSVAQRAKEELIISGARPRRERMSGVEGLTASELRVARMAAEGMTNRQIAEGLFVTEKTVELHLTHVYSKLDINSRVDLPAALEGVA